ncbi:MAG: hypothetical protein EZS28_013950 [Streblomastix strix]|uniref:Uncharacterized protein n=1 Tax=Streblomastix strix TaxID=222440 RepID=A0A5J4W7U6_9EUKA|nr:MAG: hypothetical protein EZS28_013950 [Streblomastix strix]
METPILCTLLDAVALCRGLSTSVETGIVVVIILISIVEAIDCKTSNSTAKLTILVNIVFTEARNAPLEQVFPVAVLTVAAISFLDLRELDQKPASVALVDFCDLVVFNALQSLQLLLGVVQLLQLALLTVPPRKNRFATFLAPLVQTRVSVLLISHLVESFMVLLLFSQSPVCLSQCSGGTCSQTSVAAARRHAAGFAH